ncbi:lpg1661 family Dot/Icm T4SS effector [soil metagenome]
MAVLQTRTSPDHRATKPASALQDTPARIASIDILRAITMLLMIFVNDLWSLKDIPAWLGHVDRGVDGMGLADVVFPAFLFIVGMSIPFAVANRKQKGDSTYELMLHIGSRTLALLVMGLFLVNGENLNAAATGMQRVVWYSLSCLSFILIWNVYPKTINPWISRALQVVGIGVLLTLAFVFRGGEAENVNRFSIYWWGILGLIGWSYLVSSLVVIFSGGRYYIPLAAWVLFCGLSIVASSGLLPRDSVLRLLLPGPVLGGTLVAFTLGGVLTTYLFQFFRNQQAHTKMMLALLAVAVGLAIMGFYTRLFWGISKLGATPAWLFYCSALTILAFMATYWLADLRGKAHWFRFIKPGGTDTLLCYLIPYFAYATVRLAGISLPEFMLTGGVGLLKSFAFALLCIWIAGLLSKNGVRLKL